MSFDSWGPSENAQGWLIRRGMWLSSAMSIMVEEVKALFGIFAEALSILSYTRKFARGFIVVARLRSQLLIGAPHDLEDKVAVGGCNIEIDHRQPAIIVASAMPFTTTTFLPASKAACQGGKSFGSIRQPSSVETS
jgi:hypothetical protein